MLHFRQTGGWHVFLRSQSLPEDTLTEKPPKQEATGVTEWHEYPADDFVPYPIRIAVRDGVIVDVDGKDSNASLKNLISTKYVIGDADGTDVTRLLCRTIDLEMPKPDGSIAELSVIRPLWWLQGTGAAVGGSIDIGLYEIGLSGEATVLAIGPCDVDSRETLPGISIVTGTIRHRNATVWDLTFDDRTEETLGVTANHPLYSETRHAWIPAGDLQFDEVVRTLNGHSTLTARTQRPTRETVFNLEVHRSHAYHVSGLGVLAHNSSILDCTKTNIHRGGSDFKPKYDMGEVKMKDGLVQPTRGVSLELDIARAIAPQ
ncbi:MAG: hypothetical protein DWH78_12840 [Planctomycetota bacterium]|nr:MAG: hypothetical protein DWH78_12840 [Planctomycetota bacterium]